MGYTPNNNPYVPGDPYSYDLKWIIKKIKEFDSSVAKISNLEIQFAELKAYVDNFISEADVAALVNARLDEMYDDGTLQQIIESSFVELYGPVKYYFPDLSTDNGYSGNCALAVTPAKTILLDAGPSSDWTNIKAWLDDLYYSRHVFTNIDIIVISHYHYDHIENLNNILLNFPHSAAVAYLPLNPSGYYADDATIQSNRQDVIDALNNNNVGYYEINGVEEVVTDPDFVTMKLINSSSADYAYYSAAQSPYNDYSMVTIFHTGDVYSMFPGDIQHDAQERIFNTYELPSLFLYSIHHHGIQDDDFVPFLSAISPEYAVLQTSHNRMLANRAVEAVSFGDAKVASLAYGAVEYTVSRSGGSMTKGEILPAAGDYYSYIDLYVNNEYTGTVHNGQSATPFSSISEALAWIWDDKRNLSYNIRVVKTDTLYTGAYIRDITVPVSISGIVDGGAKPKVDFLYVSGCANVTIQNIDFNGAGTSTTSAIVMLFVQLSNVYLSACDFEEANMTAGTRNAIRCFMGQVYLTGCTFTGNDTSTLNAIVAYRTGKIISAASNTFTKVQRCYDTNAMELYLRGADTITNVTTYLQSNNAQAWPVVISPSAAIAANMAYNNQYARSMPFYLNASHPNCMVVGTSIVEIDTTSI